MRDSCVCAREARSRRDSDWYWPYWDLSNASQTFQRDKTINRRVQRDNLALVTTRGKVPQFALSSQNTWLDNNIFVRPSFRVETAVANVSLFEQGSNQRNMHPATMDVLAPAAVPGNCHCGALATSPTRLDLRQRLRLHSRIQGSATIEEWSPPPDWGWGNAVNLIHFASGRAHL